MKDYLMIFDINEKNYWAVRADGATLHKLFISESFVAIKHFDKFDKVGPLKDYKGPIDRFISGIDDNSKEHAIRARVTQVDTFINKINIGDIAITVGEKMVSFGVFDGPAFFSKDPIYYDHESTKKKAVEGFFLRRKVNWGPTVDRYTLSKDLIKTLFAHQTVFSLNSHWRDICQRLFPIFKHKHKIFCSLAIRSTSQINAKDISPFLNYLTDIEEICKGSQIKIKADFNSPGFLFIEHVVGGGGDFGLVYFAYSLFFGNKIIGIDGVIPKKSREEFFSVIMKKYMLRDLEHHGRKLGIREPVSSDNLDAFKDFKIGNDEFGEQE